MPKLMRDDVDRFFDYDIHIPTRQLFMGGEVDDSMAERLIKGMTLLQNTSAEPINILMDNIGGDEYHGMGIYDSIACSPCHVTITVFGHAMSMGSWILQAADDRVMSPNATLMMHYGTWGSEDHVKYVRVQNVEMERINKLMEGVYLGRMKLADPSFPLRKLKKMLEDEVFMAAGTAVEMGLADRVLE